MAKYTLREFELHSGDCIFVYTDGAPQFDDLTMLCLKFAG